MGSSHEVDRKLRGGYEVRPQPTEKLAQLAELAEMFGGEKKTRACQQVLRTYKREGRRFDPVTAHDSASRLAGLLARRRSPATRRPGQFVAIWDTWVACELDPDTLGSDDV
jgi:hypothetical protein